MFESRESRQEEALRAARQAAQRSGLSSAGAHVIRDSNNTLVLLPEHGVVAKVSTSALDGRRKEALRRELAVGLHLAERGAPIVPPLLDGNAGPHEINGLLLTLWSYCEPQSAPNDPGVELGDALRSFHSALADFPGSLPSFTHQLDRAAALFADQRATPELETSDRQLASRIHDALRLDVDDGGQWVGLHGEPHAGNVLWTTTGPLLIDFEASCIGPREWDLAFLPERSVAAFPERNDELLALLRLAVSFCVAAWCWAQPGRAPEVREAAEFHLGVLRRSALAG